MIHFKVKRIDNTSIQLGGYGSRLTFYDEYEGINGVFTLHKIISRPISTTFARKVENNPNKYLNEIGLYLSDHSWANGDRVTIANFNMLVLKWNKSLKVN